MGEHDVAWHVESSGNGDEWRALGRAWTAPGELFLVHGAGPFLRVRPVGGQDGWMGPLARTSHACMALIDPAAGTREDLWPSDEHLGLPVFLPGGEAGRLLRFERSEDGFTWTYALEFMGEVPTKFRTEA